MKIVRYGVMAALGAAVGASFVGATAQAQSAGFLDLAERSIQNEQSLRLVETSPSGKFAIVEVTFSLGAADPLARLAPRGGVQQYFLVSKGLSSVKPLTQPSYIGLRLPGSGGGGGACEGCSGGTAPSFFEVRAIINPSSYTFTTDVNGREILTNDSLVDLAIRNVLLNGTEESTRDEVYRHPSVTMCGIYNFHALNVPNPGDLTDEAKRRIARENNVFYGGGNNDDARRLFPLNGPASYTGDVDTPASADCREYGANGILPVVTFQATSRHANLFPITRIPYGLPLGQRFFSVFQGGWNELGSFNAFQVDWSPSSRELVFSALRRNRSLANIPSTAATLQRLVAEGTLRAEPAYVFQVQDGETIASVKRIDSNSGEFFEVISSNRNVYYFQFDRDSVRYSPALEVQQSEAAAQRALILSTREN